MITSLGVIQILEYALRLLLICGVFEQSWPYRCAERVSGTGRGIEKHGGSVRLASHVKDIIVEDGKASGVRLRSGEILQASKAVISNASLNDTIKMLHPDLAVTQKLLEQAEVRTAAAKAGSTSHACYCWQCLELFISQTIDFLEWKATTALQSFMIRYVSWNKGSLAEVLEGRQCLGSKYGQMIRNKIWLLAWNPLLSALEEAPSLLKFDHSRCKPMNIRISSWTVMLQVSRLTFEGLLWPWEAGRLWRGSWGGVKRFHSSAVCRTPLWTEASCICTLALMPRA